MENGEVAVAEKEHPFYRYYGQLSHQQNMLQDSIRTGTYYNAVSYNVSDFEGKVVLDVGTGSGILSLFAAQAGAKKVYAVECSGMVRYARRLVKANGFDGVIQVILGKVEEVTIPEKVDIIISEPMGFFLVHERMLESYMIARDRFLKPEGKMFPTTGTMFVSVFSDDSLYKELKSRSKFWKQKDFYGFNISCLKDDAQREVFNQPVVGYIPTNTLITATTATHVINFEKDTVDSLKHFQIPFSFIITSTSLLHGLACWFDVNFVGSSSEVVLSTAPYSSGTHWYQCRFCLENPIAVNMGQSVSGVLDMKVNDDKSYDVTLNISLDGTLIKSSGFYHLQDQTYYYGNQEEY
ncbi:hypothetical protein WA538_003443 [Blastocystis sp. DL]